MNSDEWTELSRDGNAAVRALADWALDTVTVIRVVAGLPDMSELTESKPDTVYWHAERLYVVLAAHTSAGTVTTLIPDELTRWTARPINRDQLLRKLADRLGHLRSTLNTVSGSPGLSWLGSSTHGMPYWHAEKAHTAALTLLTGNPDDGRRLADMWVNNYEPTEYNQRLLTAEKRDESIIVTFAADGETATIRTPDGSEHDVGRVMGGGLFWVGGEKGNTEQDIAIGHHGAATALAHIVMDYHGYDADTPVIIEYDQTSPDNGTDSGMSESAREGHATT